MQQSLGADINGSDLNPNAEAVGHHLSRQPSFLSTSSAINDLNDFSSAINFFFEQNIYC